MKSWSNRFLLLVIVLDVVFVALVLSNGFSAPTFAQEGAAKEPPAQTASDAAASSEPEATPMTDLSDDPNNKWTANALNRLGSQLEQRNRELERRELELEEMMHADWVRRTMDLAPANLFPAEGAADQASASGSPGGAQEAGATGAALAANTADAESSAEQLAAQNARAEQSEMARAAFEKLQKAYANMEPTSAANALAALAKRDKDAVVQMLIGWQPRVSGAILDAITQVDPALAADLSYEIWRMGGEK